MFRTIYSQDVLIAHVYNMNKNDKGVTFPTPVEMNFQFGFGVIDREKIIAPHIHKRLKRTIDTTAELLYIIEGKMEIDIYDEQECYVEHIILLKNMALLQFWGGHKIIMAANTKYFELKQGPYLGVGSDKYLINV